MTTGWQFLNGGEDDVPLENDHRKSDGNMKRKIPKLFRRTFLGNRNFEFSNKKAKKPLSKNNSLQNSLLDIDAQVKINQNILDLQKRTGLTMVQKNGQRKLGPPPDWTGPPPGPGCEVFIGRIPRNIYEDVIYPVFRSVGEIYEIRLMMNFSGTNRGFCFIMYTKPEYAQRAIKELNNYEIHPDWQIGVVASVNNCRLHITELPTNTDVQKLIKKIWPVCEDVEKVSVYTNTLNPTVKHALISFRTHRSAAMARRRLLPEQGNFFDKADVHIEWAHPKMLISDVIEECGYCDEDGKVTITIKQILTDKKNVNIKKRSAQSSSKSIAEMKNMHAVQKPIPCNRYQKPGFCHNDYSIEKTKNNFQQFDVNQNVYQQQFSNSIENTSMNYFDQLKYSIRSDESLSDYSKSSETDDSYYSYTPCGTSTPHAKMTLPFMNQSNCAVVRFPWGHYPVNQTPNLYHNNINFHTVRFPWHLMKVIGPNSYNLPITGTPVQNHVITNAIPNYVVNNIKNIENFKSCDGINRNARPILNRKTLFY